MRTLRKTATKQKKCHNHKPQFYQKRKHTLTPQVKEQGFSRAGSLPTGPIGSCQGDPTPIREVGKPPDPTRSDP